MIRDSTLKRLSIVMVLVGIAAMYATVSLVQPQEVKISDITQSRSGQNVVVNGTIMSYSMSDGNIFITLGDGTGEITIVMFAKTARRQDAYSLKKGDIAGVEGQVNIYKSELEIIANKISRQIP